MTGAHLHDPTGHALAPDGVAWLLPCVLAVVLVAVYLGLVAGRGRATGRRWSGWRTAAWVVGVALLASGFSPWVVDLAHADARGHMLQHLLLGMYAPLGLVLGAPVTLLLGASSTRNRRRIAHVLGSPVVRVVSHPMTAGALDMGGLYLLYLTGLYVASTSSPLLHWAVNVHVVLAGTLFTWAIAGQEAAARRPSMRVRVVALVLAAAAHACLATILYAQAPALPPGSGHAAAEMEGAAQWMYYGGDLAELALAVALFAAWYRVRARSRRTTSLTRTTPR